MLIYIYIYIYYLCIKIYIYIYKYTNIQQNKRSYTETFWKTNEQRNKVKNSQHYS